MPAMPLLHLASRLFDTTVLAMIFVAFS